MLKEEIIYSLSVVAKLIGPSYESAAFVYGTLSLVESLATSVAILIVQTLEGQRTDVNGTVTGGGNSTAIINYGNLVLDECSDSYEIPFYSQVMRILFDLRRISTMNIHEAINLSELRTFHFAGDLLRLWRRFYGWLRSHAFVGPIHHREKI